MVANAMCKSRIRPLHILSTIWVRDPTPTLSIWVRPRLPGLDLDGKRRRNRRERRKIDRFSTLSTAFLLRPHISVQARERALRNKTFEPTDHPLTATTIVM